MKFNKKEVNILKRILANSIINTNRKIEENENNPIIRNAYLKDLDDNIIILNRLYNKK